MRDGGRRTTWSLLIILALLLLGLTLSPYGPSPVAKAELSLAVEPTVVKELTALKTENSKTFLLSDGTRRCEIYSAPIQFKDETGAWQEIDTALVPSTDGSYVSAATPLKVTLSPQVDAAPVVSLSYQGAAIELSMKDYAFGAPQIEGSTATYPAADAVAGSPTTDTSVTTEESTTTENTPSTIEESTTTITTAGPVEQSTTTASTADTVAESTTTVTTSTAVTESATTETTSSTTIEETTTSETTSTTEPAPNPEVSLSYEVLPSGLKETISLASANAPGSFTFIVRHPGLILHQDAKGTWGLYEMLEDGPVMVLGALTVFDSSANDTGEPAYCPTAVMAVTPGKEESTITYTVPAAWLMDPARVFPVMIDPTVNLSPASDTWISSGYPNNSYGTNTQAPIGYVDSSYKWCTGLFKFTLPADLTGGWVQSAHFKAYQYYQSTSTQQVARASVMTASWSDASTYNSLGAKTWFGSDTRSITTTTSQTQWLDFDFTSAVQAWADGTKPNYGFTMYQSQSDYNQSPKWWRRVRSSNYSDSAYWPKLTITYTPQIDASLAPYNADKTGTNDATLAIQEAIDDADAGGGVVYLPAGNYRVSGLDLSHSNLVLRGAGDNTRLMVSSAGQDYTIRIGGGSAVSNVTVKSLYVRMPAGGDGIRLEGSGGGSDITLTNLSLGGGADSSEHHGITVGSGFTDLTLAANNLTGVTALPWDYSASATRAALVGNSLSYEPYRSDYFGGEDRYDLAIRLSRATYPGGVTTEGAAAVVALGTEYPSVLCAGPLATAYSGPLLLNSSSTSLDDEVRDELQRLAPPSIFLVGLPDAVLSATKDVLPAATVTKLMGTSPTDYVGTGAAVASQIRTKKGSAVTKVIIVPYNETSAQAGLGAVVPLAAKNLWPILFTPKTGSLPSGTSTWCTTAGNMTTPRSAVEVDTSIDITGTFTGGVSQIGASGTESAWVLAAHVAENEVNNCTYTYSGIASGGSWPDAALLGSYLGKNGGRLLLTDGEGDLPPETVAALDYVALDYLAYVNLPALFVADENPGFWVPGAPRHTTYDLGSFAGHSVQATLDESALNVDTTDLLVASYGPRAALDRHYSSVATALTTEYFAPGWHFSFERALDLSDQASGRVEYIDEYGETYTFLKQGSAWVSPPGFTATLVGYGGWSWELTLPGGNRLAFYQDGKLSAEIDPQHNAVSYYWNGNGEYTRIVAANGQEIVLSYASGRMASATYQTAAGTRTVTYTTGSPWSVTYSYTGSPSTASRSLSYAYTSNLLTGLTANSFTATHGNSTETFAYSSGALTAVYFPDYDASANPDARATLAYNGREATITTHGRVYSPAAAQLSTPSASDWTPSTDVTQVFTWNPSGTLASKTSPKTASESPQTWTYTYSYLTNYQTSETNPLGQTKSFTYNTRGSLTSETDELGNKTTYTYPDLDPLYEGSLELRVSSNADDVYNTDATLRTTYSYQVMGHGTYVDTAGWRFQNVQIPKGAVITSATLSLTAYANASGSPSMLINTLGCEAAPNPGVWAEGTHEPVDATLTSWATHEVEFVPRDDQGQAEWIAGNTYESDSFALSVQEVIGASAWQPGNALCVIVKDLGTEAVNFIQAVDYSSSPASAALLRVTWGRNPEPDLRRDLPAVVSKPDGSKTYYTYDKHGMLLETQQTVDENKTADTRYSYTSFDPLFAQVPGALAKELVLEEGSWDNLLAHPSEFEDSAWVKTGSAVASNVFEGPVGTEIEADKLCENDQNSEHKVGQTFLVTAGEKYRYSVYVKASDIDHPSSRDQVGITFTNAGSAFSPASAIFNVNPEGGGTVVSSGGLNAGVDVLGEGFWFRVWAEQTALASTSSASVTIGLASNGSLTYTGAGHATPVSGDPGVYLWGADCIDTTYKVCTTYDSGGYNLNGLPVATRTLSVALGNGPSLDLTSSETYNAFGLLTSRTDTSGQTTETNTYDLAGRRLTSTGPTFTATIGANTYSTQIVTRQVYDAWGHETESWTTSTGEAAQTKADWTTSAYDKAGRVSQTKRWLFSSPPPSGTPQSTVDITYDGLGRQIIQTDTTVSNLPALTAYDARGNLVADWAGGACTSGDGYDLVKASRHVQSDTYPNNTPAYDAVSRELMMTQPGDTNPTTYEYIVVQQSGPDIQKVKETQPDGSWKEDIQDAAGNVTSTKTSTSGSSNLSTASYDGLQQLTLFTLLPGDPREADTDYTYDLVSQQTEAQLNDNPASQFTYNALGWQLAVEDPDGVTTTRIYDQAGRMVSETNATEYTTIFTYDGAGHLTLRDDPNDRWLEVKYDFFGRENRSIHTLAGTPRVTVADTETTHDSLGRPTQVTDNVRRLTHSFTYPQNTPGNTTDVQGVGSSGSDLVTTTLTMGADGLEASRASVITSSPQIPNLTRTVTARDEAQRLTSATLATGPSQNIYARYSFNAAGQIEKQWGTTGGGSGYTSLAETTTAYTYSATSGLKTGEDLWLASVGTAGRIQSSYTYTPDGRLATAMTNGVTETDTFDAAGNLTSLGTGTSLTYTENRLETMTVDGQTTYFFFDSGKKWRTVQAPTNSESDPNRTAFAYTGTGRLQTWTKYTGGSATTNATYTYDAQGQRTQSVVDDDTSGLVTTTDFVYQGLLLQSLSAAQTGTGATSWKITYLYDEYGKPYAGIYRSPGSSTNPIVFALVTTDRGDVVELLDAAGAPFAAYRYDAWGNPQGTGNVGTGIWSQGTSLVGSQMATNIATRQVLRYATYYYDSESGLYYLSARSYDPKTRQFLSKDLSRNDGEQSAYQYCGGNPVGRIDTTGYATRRYGHFSGSATNRIYNVTTVVTGYYVWTDDWRATGMREAVRVWKVSASWWCKGPLSVRARVSKVKLLVREDYPLGNWFGPCLSPTLYPTKTYYSGATVYRATHYFRDTDWFSASPVQGYKLRAYAQGFRPLCLFPDLNAVATKLVIPDLADPGQ